MLDFNLDLKDTAERFQTGTINTLGVFALNASLKLFKEFGYDNVEKNVLDNSEYLIHHLKRIGIHPMADVKREFLSGIVTFRHPEAKAIYEKLERENIICSIREGALRIAPHFYNTEEDLNKLILVIIG
jgi:cysteine desulfurase / selenocysteine lyase